MADPDQEKIAPVLFAKLISIGPNRENQLMKLAKELNIDLDTDPFNLSSR